MSRSSRPAAHPAVDLPTERTSPGAPAGTAADGAVTSRETPADTASAAGSRVTGGPADAGTRVLALGELLAGTSPTAPVVRLAPASIDGGVEGGSAAGTSAARVVDVDVLGRARARPAQSDGLDGEPRGAGRPRARRPGRRAAAAPGAVDVASGGQAHPGSTIAERVDAAGADRTSDADPETVARAICLRLLTDRARTRQELAQALRRRGVPDDAANSVLDRFDDVGLIDDQAFAAQWVRSRHAYRGLGRRALAVELRRKGVADGVAGEALAAVDTESEERRARDLVERRLRGLRTDTDEHRAAAGRKLVGMLARKGYGAGIAYRVVREALAALGAELEELASEPPADD